MNSLGGQDDQISKFAGESVIIDDRNAKCLQVMDKQIKKQIFNPKELVLTWITARS